MRGMVAPLQNFHHVTVLDEALESAVKLSRRYIPSRQLPDKAVSVLDTACAKVSLSPLPEGLKLAGRLVFPFPLVPPSSSHMA